MLTKYNQVQAVSDLDTEVVSWRASCRHSTRASLVSKVSIWISGPSFGVAVNVLVLLVSLVLTLVSAFAFPRHHMLSILVSGSCSKSRSVTGWLHILINVLCTVLHGTNSFAIRYLISPTRAEIDKAHQAGNFMDIGIASRRNFGGIGRRRRVLLVLVVLTSLPIHLLANSAVFGTVGTDSYLLVAAYQPLITDLASEDTNSTILADWKAYNATRFTPNAQSIAQSRNTQAAYDNVLLDGSFAKELRTLVPTLTRLDNKRCIEEYSKPLITGYRHVIAVSEADISATSNQSPHSMVDSWFQSIDMCPTCQTPDGWTDPSLWTCAFLLNGTSMTTQVCDSHAAAAHASEFRINDIPISYCLSEEVDEKCQVQANVGILGAVVACAFLNLCTLLLAMQAIPDDVLITIGDAIASFLARPDPTTEGCCLLSYEDVRGMDRSKKALQSSRHNSKLRQVLLRKQDFEAKLTEWIPGYPFLRHWSTLSLRPRYMQALPAGYLIGQTSAFSAVLVLAIAFLAKAIVKMKTDTEFHSTLSGGGKILIGPPASIPALWRFGFGALNQNFLVPFNDLSSPGGIEMLRHSLVINSLQIMVTLCYYGYYNMWTNMLLAREWASYGLRRQGLRVSRPQSPHQRGSFFLTMPLTYAIPLQIASTLLHWLLSQSLFLARINIYGGEPFTHYPVRTINTIGYSPIALFFFIMFCIVLLVALCVAGMFHRFQSPIPVVGSCSLAISAACHPPACERMDNIALKEVMWGVVPAEFDETNDHVQGIEELEMEVRHCSFSIQEVVSPETLPLKRINGSDAGETVALFR